MAQRKVVWTETAARQRRLILEYWVEHNQSITYSYKLLQLSDEKTNLMAKNPRSYKKSEFPDTRVASMGHFSLFYKTADEHITITAFWDNRQDPKKLLELLKDRE